MTERAEIVDLAAQGHGVTAHGVYVPGTLPGETVEIARTEHRGVLRRVLTSAPARMMPTCAHFGQCGGCAVQHASDAFVADWKRDLIARALAARGIVGADVLATHTSPVRSRRRATWSLRRTRKTILAGFHAAGSDEIVPVEACTVVTPALMNTLPALIALAGIGASRKGLMRATVTETETGVDVAITGGKPIAGPMYGLLVAEAAKHALARLSWDGEAVVVRHPPVLRIRTIPVLPPAGAFLQATADGEAALIDRARLLTSEARSIIDLFAGIGTFTLSLADRSRVHAVEGDAPALAALDTAWRQGRGLKQVTHEQRDLFRRPVLSRELGAYDTAIVDPPRQGARAQTEQLAASALSRIVMVSCNPATFARDARTLIDGGYRMGPVQPVDQFRWSAHVELIAGFARP